MPRFAFGALPDDVLLQTFDFYLARINFKASRFSPLPEDAWHTLAWVHVCMRW